MEFNYELFVDSLMRAMNMAEADIETQKDTRHQIETKLSLCIAETLATEPIFIEVLRENPQISMAEAVAKTIERSPELSEKLAIGIDNLYTEIMEVFMSFQ